MTALVLASRSMRSPARLAYLVMAHKTPEQTNRLVRAISSPLSLVGLHVDAKAPAEIHAAARATTEATGALLLRSRAYNWCGFSSIRVPLSGIHQLLEAGSWDFLLNVSGQDYPLRPQAEIADELAATPRANFVEHFAGEECPEYLGRFSRYTIEPFGRAFVVPKLPRLHRSHLRPFFGSAWWILSRAFCEWIASPPADLVRLFRYSWCPDESFFQTAALNGPFRDSVVNHNRRFILWPAKHGCAHPLTLGPEHVDAMLASSAYFARKIDNPAVLDRLDARLHRSANVQARATV